MTRQHIERFSDMTSYKLSRRVALLEIKGIKKAVLRVLADHYPNVWPSIDTIASQAGFGTTATRTAVRELERDAYIAPCGHKHGGRCGSEQYVINVELILAKSESPKTQRDALPFKDLAGGTENPTPRAQNPTSRVPNPTPDVAKQSSNRAEAGNHHAHGALNDWLFVKAKMEGLLARDEYNLWMRPMYLLKVMGKQMLLSLPRNRRIIDAARSHQALLSRLLREKGYSGCSLTRYPDGYERERLAVEFPEFYAQMYGNQNKKPQGSALCEDVDCRHEAVRSASAGGRD